MITKRIGLRHARHHLAEILMRARYKNETFLISKHGEPLALVIPIDCIPTLQPAVDPPAAPLSPAAKRFATLAKFTAA